MDINLFKATGRLARQYKKSILTNPYEIDSQQWQLWRDGWTVQYFIDLGKTEQEAEFIVGIM